MIRWWDVAMDLILFGTWGILFSRLLELLGEESRPRDARGRWKGILVCVLPVFLWHGILGYCQPVRQFFYGEKGITDSSSTIVTNGISLLVLFGCGCFFVHGKSYRGKLARPKRLVLYLTLFFGALSEMTRFGMYGLGGRLFNGVMERLCGQVNEGTMEAAEFYRLTALVQIAWNLLYFLFYLVFLALAVHRSRKSHQDAGRLPRGRELLYLSVPPLISLCFGVLMRSIMLMTREGQLYSIYEENQWLYFLTPLICALCIGMMLGSVHIWSRIVGEEREKSELLIYQSRVEDMEQYVGDLERMQEGLWGMKHDLKNYIADIQALMNLGEDGTARKELTGYLSGMEQIVRESDIRFHTGNPVTDVLLNRHMQQARELSAAAEWNFFFPREQGFDPFDMSIILNNGLNNALESCRGVPKDQRWITLNGRREGRIFLVEIKNAAKGFGPVEPGQGMKNMMRCAKKYQGHMEWEHKEGEFRLTVLLQARQEQ